MWNPVTLSDEPPVGSYAIEGAVDCELDAAADLCSVDNAHVHASLAGVVQEGAVEATPHSLIAPEGEGNVGHPTTDLAARAQPFDLTSGSDEVHCIVVVLSHAGAHRQDVGVEDDVLGVEPHILNQNLVGSGANADFVL